jgi:5-methylcytosine-specific restriction endonuclease McrBC regulatory subunit McrC
MITPSEAKFVGKIRGKPILQATIRANLAKARLDRTYCRFQVQSIDTVPNQILVAALHQATKYLRRSNIRDGRLLALTGFSISALSGVTLRRISPTDFRGPHYGGLLRPYREPHQWAALVLRLLGPDPLNENTIDERVVRVPPFAIDMNELFERYCEVVLRTDPAQRVWAGYKDQNLGSGFKVRPDFLVKASDGAWIVDAKYKENWNWSRKEHKLDVLQIVTYSRHREVLKQLELTPDHDQRPNAVIVYPGPSESDPEPRLSLRTPESHDDVLQDFQVTVMRIPLDLPRGAPRSSR